MYVVLQPHSNTNPSEYFRVVKSSEWSDHAYGRASTLPVYAETKTYGEADIERDRLNASIAGR